MNKRSFYWFSVALCFSFILFSKNVNAQLKTDIENLKEKYTKHDLVRWQKELNIDIGLENDNIVITQNSIDEDLFLNESATQYSKESVSYSTFFKIENLKASSFNLENGEYKEYPVNEFRTKDELEGSFYDDVKSVNFIYPNLNSGSKTKLELKEKVMNSRFLNAFYFGGYYPVINSKLTITVDNNIELDFKEYNTGNIDILFTKKEKKSKTVYTWESKNVGAIEMENSTPNFKNYYPHIIPVITKYKTKNKGYVNLSSEVADLYDWYYSLVKNINSEPLNHELVELVNSLSKNEITELEKVRSIYYWVQNNIKYIAFEYALGGFIPREANDIYQKKFGDCKDNSSILYEMLKAAGIKGELTWIGTRSIPYKYNELPTPSVDNHMILYYQNGNKGYFLDATGRYIPLEMPTSFIQGKEALISQGEGKFKILEVPIMSSERNSEINLTHLFVDQKELKGNATKKYTGYNKIDIFNKLENLNTSKERKDFFNEILKKGNNKFSSSNEVEHNKFAYDEDYSIDYELSISDYIIQASDEIYINLNLDKILREFIIEDKRKTDIEIDYKNSYVFVNELSIPEGYHVTYLPEDISYANDLVSSSISYEKKEDKIIYTHKVAFDFLIMRMKDQKEYSDLIKKIEKAYKEIIILKKNEI